MCRLAVTLALLIGSVHAFAATWYVRPNGGTRYSTNMTGGQCNGTTDADYPGSGTNQNCAFRDARYLYQDGSYNPSGSGFPTWGWVGTGGDTYVVRGSVAQGVSYRLGWNINTASCDPATNCWGVQGDPSASMPPLPSGTSGQHTRLLSGCAYDGNCAQWSYGNSVQTNVTNTALTQLHGGFGLYGLLNVGSAQYIDIAGFELTDWAQCAKSVGNSDSCVPFPDGADDYAQMGVTFNNGSANITLTTMLIHGLAHDGLFGPVGGPVTQTDVVVSGNAHAGWDLDNGTASTSAAVNTLHHVLYQWNGALEEYPVVHNPNPYLVFGQDNGGYGDAIGTNNGDSASWLIDQGSVFRYNAQDGPDLLHSNNGSMAFIDSQSYGNSGQQLKLGAVSTDTIRNSLFVANCNVLVASNTFPGARPGFNAKSAPNCRASDVFRFEWNGTGTFSFDHNTVIAGSPTVMDIDCVSDCTTGTKTLRDNIFVGYVVSGFNANQAPGMFCYTSCNGVNPSVPADDSLWTARSNNRFFTMRACPDNLRTGESCADPQLTTVLSNPTTDASFFFNGFDLRLSAASTSRGAGAAISGQSNDYAANPWATPPSLGALEYGSSYASGSTPPPVTTTIKILTRAPRGTVQ